MTSHYYTSFFHHLEDLLQSTFIPSFLLKMTEKVLFMEERGEGMAKGGQTACVGMKEKGTEIHLEKVNQYVIDLNATTCLNLEVVNLKKGITREDAIALAKALEWNETVEQLSLMNNDIGSEGGCAIASALKRNRTLKYIDLRGTNIGLHGCRAVAEALMSNQSLMYLNGVDLTLFAQDVFGLSFDVDNQTKESFMKEVYSKRRREYFRQRHEFLLLRCLKNNQRILDRPCLKGDKVGVAILATLSVTDLPFRNILMFLSC